jgi:mannose-6-phosphate isomerase-like protein (cupin superfamily)
MAMSPAPRRIENPVTGDRIEFLSSPLHGDSGPLIFRTTLAANAKGSPLHAHRTIAETFEVVRGELLMEVGSAGRFQALTAGAGVELAPGALHSFRNPLNEETVVISAATPGAQFEKFLRTMYGLAADGQTNVDGLPKDPRALALTLQYADLVIANFPNALQTALIGGLAGLGRMARLERGFARYWPAADAFDGQLEAA